MKLSYRGLLSHGGTPRSRRDPRRLCLRPIFWSFALALTFPILAVGVGGYGGTVERGNERLGTQSQATCFRDPAGQIAGGFGKAGFDLVPTIAFTSSRDNPTLLPVLSWTEI